MTLRHKRNKSHDLSPNTCLEISDTLSVAVSIVLSFESQNLSDTATATVTERHKFDKFHVPVISTVSIENRTTYIFHFISLHCVRISSLTDCLYLTYNLLYLLHISVLFQPVI